MEDSASDGLQDSLPEWSKGVDSSSTSASCVGSNPTAVISSVAALPGYRAREYVHSSLAPADAASSPQLAEHAPRKRMVVGSTPAGGPPRKRKIRWCFSVGHDIASGGRHYRA